MISLEPGQRFAGRYEVVGVLGKGGFSVVYKAVQLGMNRPVALKLMMPTGKNVEALQQTDQALDTFAKRFEVEARILSTLKSNATVTVYDFGQTEDGVLFMALEFVDGHTLDKLPTPMSAERSIAIMRQILMSLKEAHQQSVLHRDIKPQNIMVFDHLDQKDQVKLLDFGIAKQHQRAHEKTVESLTQHGTLIGTPRYMAPEVICGEAQLPASDLYALGLVWYEMITGQRAIDADSSIAVIAKQISAESVVLPEALDISPGLRQIIDKMIIKDLAVRFQSSQQVLDALDALDKAPEALTWVAVEPIEEAPKSPSSWLKVVIAAVLLVGLAGLGYLFVHDGGSSGSSNTNVSSPTVKAPKVALKTTPKEKAPAKVIPARQPKADQPPEAKPEPKSSPAVADTEQAKAVEVVVGVTRQRVMAAYDDANKVMANRLAEKAVEKPAEPSTTDKAASSPKKKAKASKPVVKRRPLKRRPSKTPRTDQNVDVESSDGRPKVITKSVDGPIF